jgi:hypothetical protein
MKLMPGVAKRAVAAWYAQDSAERLAYAKSVRRAKATNERALLLNPNAHSEIMIEGFLFSLNPSQFSQGTCLEWGVPNGWTAFKNPQVPFRATRLVANVPTHGLCYLSTIQAANVIAEVGAVSDAYCVNDLRLSLPCLPPQNTMQVTGTWTSYVPPGRLPCPRTAFFEDVTPCPGGSALPVRWYGRTKAQRAEFNAWQAWIREAAKAKVFSSAPRSLYVLCLTFEGWAALTP